MVIRRKKRLGPCRGRPRALDSEVVVGTGRSNRPTPRCRRLLERTRKRGNDVCHACGECVSDPSDGPDGALSGWGKEGKEGPPPQNEGCGEDG